MCQECEREMTSMPGPFTLPVGNTGLTCYAAVEYAGIAKRAVETVKYSANFRLAEALGRMLLLPVLQHLADTHPESCISRITPVPASPRGRRSRGFDQTLLMARVLGLPIESPLRRLNGLQQKRLTKKDRRTNAEHQYILSPTVRYRSVPDGSVVLLDDVVTTGASLERCIELLRSRGYNVAAALTCTATL